MKLVKIFYRTAYLPDENCLDKCPFNETCQIGSIACKTECKYCIGSGTMPAWVVWNEKEFNLDQKYVICSQTYKTPMKFRKFLYKIKILFEKYVDN